MRVGTLMQNIIDEYRGDDDLISISSSNGIVTIEMPTSLFEKEIKKTEQSLKYADQDTMMSAI